MNTELAMKETRDILIRNLIGERNKCFCARKYLFEKEKSDRGGVPTDYCGTKEQWEEQYTGLEIVALTEYILILEAKIKVLEEGNK